jgi:type I restriction enzyme M protein
MPVNCMTERVRTLGVAVRRQQIDGLSVFNNPLHFAQNDERAGVVHGQFHGIPRTLLKAVSWRVETAPPVTSKIHKPGKVQPDPLRGLFERMVEGKPMVVEYEQDSELRDTEQIPLLEEDGIEAFLKREVLPYTPDDWLKEDSTKIGYEVSFTRHFYKPQPLQTLEEIRADIVAAEKEAEGLPDGILTGGKA